MIAYEGRLLNLGTVDRCARKFSEDCKIKFPNKVPVTYNFQSGVDNVLGFAEISQDDDGLNCRVTMTNDDFKASEYYVGGYYKDVKRDVNESVTVITSGKLTSMSIVPDCDCCDENMKIRKVKEE